MYWKVWGDLFNTQIMKKAEATHNSAHYSKLIETAVAPSHHKLYYRFKQYWATPLALYAVSRGKEPAGGRKTDSQPHVVELGEIAFNCLLHNPKKSFDQYRIFTQEIPQRGSKTSEINDVSKGFDRTLSLDFFSDIVFKPIKKKQTLLGEDLVTYLYQKWFCSL